MDFDDYPVINRKVTGENLKKIMQERGIAVRDVQRYLNLACPQSVYRWLDGANMPSIDNLYALSKLFRLSIDSMVCGSKKRDCRDEKMKDEHFNVSQYSMIVTWSDDDQAYIVSVPELPGCMADGRSREEAVRNAQTIIDEWIEYAKELGREIPEIT